MRLTEEEKQEILRRKRIAAKKKKIRRRRRAYALLLVCVIILVAVVFYNAGRGDRSNSVSDNSIVSAGAGAVADTHTTQNNIEETADAYTGIGYTMPNETTEYSGGIDARARGNSLDVSTGYANVNLLTVEENGGNVITSAKYAMQNNAYFVGSNNTVNNILLAYAPDGNWHAVKTTGSDICVFFTGHHGSDAFRVTFSLLNDGTFYLDEVRVNGENISDPVVFITEII